MQNVAKCNKNDAKKVAKKHGKTRLKCNKKVAKNKKQKTKQKRKTNATKSGILVSSPLKTPSILLLYERFSTPFRPGRSIVTPGPRLTTCGAHSSSQFRGLPPLHSTPAVRCRLWRRSVPSLNSQKKTKGPTPVTPFPIQILVGKLQRKRLGMATGKQKKKRKKGCGAFSRRVRQTVNASTESPSEFT